MKQKIDQLGYKVEQDISSTYARLIAEYQAYNPKPVIDISKDELAFQAANDITVTDLFSNASNGIVLEGGHGPVARTATNIEDKVFIKFCPVRCVHHFGVELDGVEFFRLIGDGGKGGAG